MAPRPKRSIIWSLASELDNGGASCNLCNKIIKRGSNPMCKNTTNITRHLRNSHPDEYTCEWEKNEKQKKEKEKKIRKVDTFFPSINTSDPSTSLSNTQSSLSSADTIICTKSDSDSNETRTLVLKQPTLMQNLESKKKWNKDDSRTIEVHYKIGEMIAKDCQPIAIVNDKGFRDLIHLLEPRYPIPGRHFLSEKIIPSMYETARKVISDGLKKASFFSFTTDIWSTGEKTFISCTAHCISKNFEQQVLLLHVSPFPENHTGENIEHMLKKMIKDFNIPDEKIHQICHDNASNMMRGVENIGYSSLCCFIHTTQLALKCISNQGSVKNLINKCRNIASHFHRSPKSCQMLADLQKTLDKERLVVIQDVTTRWNSTFFMLKRMLEIKRELVLFLVENHSEYNLSTDECDLMEKLVKLLQPFNEATER